MRGARPGFISGLAALFAALLFGLTLTAAGAAPSETGSGTAAPVSTIQGYPPTEQPSKSAQEWYPWTLAFIYGREPNDWEGEQTLVIAVRGLHSPDLDGLDLSPFCDNKMVSVQTDSVWVKTDEDLSSRIGQSFYVGAGGIDIGVQWKPNNDAGAWTSRQKVSKGNLNCPTPTPTPSASPSPTPTPTVEPSPTVEPTPTSTPTETAAPTPSATPTPSETATPTPSATTPTVSPTPTVTNTASAAAPAPTSSTAAAATTQRLPETGAGSGGGLVMSAAVLLGLGVVLLLATRRYQALKDS